MHFANPTPQHGDRTFDRLHRRPVKRLIGLHVPAYRE